jgi:hypothetical protein
MSETLVGKKIWHKNPFKRVYEKNADGHAIGGPIYSAYWEEIEVIGETSRSWLVGYKFNHTKIAKKDLAEGKLQGYKLTRAEVDEDIYFNTHRHKITSLVSDIKDVKLLKAVADLIGYKP